MALIINASGFHKTASQSYNQRTRSGSVTLNNGALIDYAIVATGFGADGWGERVAQMAIDAVLVQFDRGNDPIVPSMLEKAIKSANHEIYWSTRKSDDVYAHISVAVVENEENLYVASVGANSIFLARGERLTQLTMSDPATANADDLEDLYTQSWQAAVGKAAEVSVDRGFHIDESMSDAEFTRAQVRGGSGLPIREGDSILVCSQNFQSGLDTDKKRKGKFVDLFALYDGKRAIDEVLSRAAFFGAEGSFSVATLQARPGSRLDYATSIKKQLIKNPVQFYNGLAIGVVAIVAIFAFVYLRNRPTVPDELVQPSVVARLSTSTPQANEVVQIETVPAADVSTDSDSENEADEPIPTSPPAVGTAVPTEQTVVQLKPPSDQTDEPDEQAQEADTGDRATSTVEPQLTVTIEPVTSTVTITVSETVSPTVAPERVYYRPVLLNMNCAATWENYAQDSKIELNWRWNGRTYGNEYLEVRVGPRGGTLQSIGQVFAEPEGNFYRWFITPQGYFLDGVTQEFQWQVVHMAPNGRTVLAQSGRGCFTVR